MGGSNLVQAATNLFDWSSLHNTKNEASQLSQSVYFWQQRAVKNNIQEKGLFSTSAFEKVSVAAAATTYQEPHFWTRLKTEGQN